jgi:hypothetical protein
MDKLIKIPIIRFIQYSNTRSFCYVDVNLMDHRPSTIALAATLMVSYDAALTREIMDLQIGEILLQLNLDRVSFLSRSLSGFCFLCLIINKHYLYAYHFLFNRKVCFSVTI